MGFFRTKKYLLIAVILIFIIIILFLNKIIKRPSCSEIVLWAWERQENLLFINNKNIKIAYYAGEITFKDSEVNIRPRHQPLYVNPGTQLTAVFRIENLEKSTNLTDQQISKASNFIIETCVKKSIKGCQIDYDVKSSEIDSYKKFISLIRKKLSKSIFLSITALASWCHSKSWLEDLDVDEIVPMFYRLGPEEHIIKNGLTGSTFIKSEIFQKAIGISIDETLPLPKHLRNKKIYIFNPHSWKSEDFYNIMSKISKTLKE